MKKSSSYGTFFNEFKRKNLTLFHTDPTKKQANAELRKKAAQIDAKGLAVKFLN
jgi:hypothetical protein